jgi:hypothetical protein
MAEHVTSVDGDRTNCIYARISIQLSSTWPGEAYLRFEPFNNGPQTMIRVLPGDIVSIAQLGDLVPTELDEQEMRQKILRHLATMRPEEREALLSEHRHPSSWT